MEAVELPVEVIKKITHGFTDKIGEGAFGVVYKGTLENGQQVAVKKLRDLSAVKEREFHLEVQILKMVDHPNVVKLIGYCCHKENTVQRRRNFGPREVVEKFLCFEYITNGSLDKHIYGEPSKLGWPTRFQIVKGLCKGLQVLHEQERPIIHSDLNPANVLLDADMEPKLADFGLSRLFGENQTHTCIMNAKSAIAYMAPEYLERGQLSIQSDIYSLGLLIIEITTGEKNSFDSELLETDIMANVRENWTKISYIALKYEALSPAAHRQVKGCIEIGLSCLKRKRSERPTSANIIKEINKIDIGSSSVRGKISIFGRK